MAAPPGVMPVLCRLLCRVYRSHVRLLCAGRHRVIAAPAAEEQIAEPAGDMGADTNLLKQFPAPKNLLHCAISRALRTSQLRDKMSYIHSGGGSHNRVLLRLKWPKLIEVEGYGSKKVDAERQAAARACKILQDLGLLRSGHLVGKGNVAESLDTTPVSSRTRSRIHSRESRSVRHSPSAGSERPQSYSDAPVTLRRGNAVQQGSRVAPMDLASEDAEATSALRVFSNPKHLLSSVIQVATSVSASSNFIQYQHIGGRVKMCRLTLRWPEPMAFVAGGQRWIEAERKAAALACQKLKDLGLLDPQNRPLTNVKYNQSSVQKFQEQQKQAKKFQVSEHLLQRMEDYFIQFPLEPVSGSHHREDDDKAGYMEVSDEASPFYDPITGRPYSPISEAEASYISRSLKERWDSSVALQDLPADQHRELILAAIRSHQVVVIAGDTGCGKTTRIPRYILEDAILSGNGAHCNLLITQPRRISAVSVAHRVGQELGPKLRRNVGYQVRLDSDLPPRGGALLFCTVGVLLKKLQMNPGLEGVSHVVVDEVHERDVNTDFLLILLKQLLDMNSEVKIILMSATGDNHRISRYFGDCPIVRVPGFMYPVEGHYLEEILPMMGRKSYQKPQTAEDCVPDLDLISDVILHIDKCGPPGGILCFLPGWQEIRRVQEILQERLAYRNGHHLILPVHSNIPLTNQQAIFERSPPGVRKIVLATNIAETSVTIDDIVHVVDTGMHKEQRYDLRTKVSCLETTWVSKSNVTQRRGRAGRCQPGFSYHLFTHKQHQDMPTFQVAEILRTPLENLVVQAKIHTPEMTALEFLSQALESPDRYAIMDAVRFLQEIRVLDEKEGLTLLGQRVASISTDPSLAKAIVLASIFRCLHPLLVIVACLTKDPFQGGVMNRTEVNKVKTMFSGQSCSDHLVFTRVYEAWKEVLSEGSGACRADFLEDNLLSKSALRFIQGLITQFSSNVEDASLVCEAKDCTNGYALCNQLSDQDELVKGVLLAGLYPKLIQVSRGYVIRGKFRPNSLYYKTKSGPVLLHKSTVNREVKDFCMPWLTYFQAVKSSGAVFVRDSSMVHPLAVLLMTNSLVTVRDNGEQMMVSLSDSNLLKLESDSRTIALLRDLRQAVSQMVERNLQAQLLPPSPQEQAQYSKLLAILVELLNSTAHCFTEQPAAIAEE